MNNLLNDIELDIVVGGLQAGYKECRTGTTAGASGGVVVDTATCNGNYADWFAAAMKAHGLGQPH